ncbi:M15 family metallopeptidase [Aquibacillus albus]|uniref:Peptidoglycan L-alanyl-D-glutamate endopeptidase CwlK n=1 Tax=Aquibacillus albus TaxID=1168171 RepID=A0ABS2MZ83_9BACI|nr:M15 family metallopeptidase [Aquibacillus albus]MBM7571209.1 peptidoglycan L-alanyl-D-glutamate endopeptidase CwlK [Aquibacillus albus]
MRINPILTIAFLSIIVMIGYLLWQDREQLNLENNPPPTTLHLTVEKYKDILIERAEEQGITIIITDDIRTIEEQDAIYARGRTEPGSIVTYAEGGESYHNYGLAIDFALLSESGEIIWDINYDGNQNGKADWTEVAVIAKELGFQWGGDWERFKDYPHLQMTFGYSIWQLKFGFRPDPDEEPVIRD